MWRCQHVSTRSTHENIVNTVRTSNRIVDFDRIVVHLPRQAKMLLFFAKGITNLSKIESLTMQLAYPTLPQFTLIYGNGLDVRFISAIQTELDALPHLAPAICVSVNKVVKEHCNNHVVVLVTHSVLTIDKNAGSVSYVAEEEMSGDSIVYFRDHAASFWFAGCCAANIDVSCAPTAYDPNVFGRKLVHPFTACGYSNEPAVPFVSAYWLISFLRVTRCYNIWWWTVTSRSFYFDLALQQKASPLLSAVRTHARSLGLPFADMELYPYHVSFPEVVHMAVFRAIYPNSNFIMGNNPPELFGRVPSFMRKLTSIGIDGNTNWLRYINGPQLLQKLPCSFEDAVRCYREGHGGELSSYLLSYLRSVSASTVLDIGSTILTRLMLNESVQPHDNIRRVAIVCRTSMHSGDMRMYVNSPMFISTVSRVCQNAVRQGWGIIVMDGREKDILDLVEQHDSTFLDATEHNKGKQGDLNTVQQMQLLQRCVQKFNIEAAVGVHGGFLDVLAILGVSPARTIRLCCDKKRKFRQTKFLGWRERTENMHILFHGGQDCNWFEYTAPSDAHINSLFA